MKSTSTSSKNNTTFNTKSKKNPKDREKRKSIVGYEKNETHNTNEKGSPCKVNILFIPHKNYLI